MTEVSNTWLKCWGELMTALYGGTNHQPSELMRRIMAKYEIKEEMPEELLSDEQFEDQLVQQIKNKLTKF